MLRQLLKVFLLLIIAYLVLVHWGGFSQDISHSGTALVNITKAFQGR